MSKITKIIVLIIFLFSLCFHFSYATDNIENMNEDVNTLISDLEETKTNDETLDTTNSIKNNSGVTSVSQLSNYSEANLGLNNILSIILIAIGVLIILFAIAILIRLKH